MIEKFYYEYVFDEVLELLKTNMLLYYRNNDDYFPYLKDFCSDKDDEAYETLDYWRLVFFAEEALAELINCDYYYDLRPLE